MRVYISMTTIPSRLNRIVESNLMHLFEQNFPVENIILTVPLNNMRGDKWDDDLPEFLSKEPFSTRVTVVRPKNDLGPIMKYVGFTQHDTDDDVWVWVCDDDQLYRPHCISWCVNIQNALGNDINTVVSPKASFDFFTKTIKGYCGVFLHKSVLQKISDYVTVKGIPRCCTMIDDNYVSFILKNLQVNVHMLEVDKEDIFESGSERKEATDALHTAHPRGWDQLKCGLTMDYTFVAVFAILATLLGLIIIVTLCHLTISRRA